MPLQHPLIRKERERLSKREDIIRAARAVFALRGYENATLDEIAERAEFAKGTLYNYFDSKGTLFAEIVEGALNDVVGLAEETRDEGGEIRDQFQRFAVRMMEYYKANEDLLRILTRELSRLQLEQELSRMSKHARLIAAVLASGIRKEIRKRTIIRENPLELANIFIGMVHDRVMRVSLERRDLSALNVRKEAVLVTRLFFEGAALG